MEPHDREVDDGLGALRGFVEKKENDAAKWLKIIEEMLGDYERFSWAEDTLIGIYDHVMNHGTISDKQIAAVENIHTAGSNPRRRW